MADRGDDRTAGIVGGRRVSVSDQPRLSLSELRRGDLDATLQNVLRALTLNLELRSHYRVFQFESRHQGLDDLAQLFGRLEDRQTEQVSELLAGLRARLEAIGVTAP
jgi:hypothetical protein